MASANAASVEIKGIITALNANFNYRQQPERWEFPQQGQQPTSRVIRPKPELDTENVRLSFMVTSPEMGDVEISSSSHGSITMKRDDIKRLNLTVGDTITLSKQGID